MNIRKLGHPTTSISTETRHMEVAFLVPADLPEPSGGSNYNHAMIDHLAAAGHRVRVIRVPGPWPRPEPSHRVALAAAMASSSIALVDGIMALAAPEVVAAAMEASVAVHILLHSCLSADVALNPLERENFAAAERSAMQAARTVICTSHWAARDVHQRHHITTRDIVSPGTSSAVLAQGSSPPQFLFLAALTPVKNQLLALSSLAMLTDLPWTASFVGSPTVDPRYARILRHVADRDFVPGRVKFCGALAGPQLEKVWNRTDLLLLTSRTETFGMVITEALARGIPAVVSAGTGAVEALLGADTDRPALADNSSALMSHGIDAPLDIPGAVVDPGEPSELLASLRQWLTEPDRRARWREVAVNSRDGLRTWDEAAATMWEILYR